MSYTKNEKIAFYNERKLENTKTWLMFLILGWCYGNFGQMGKQILFYLTFGGCGIWTLITLLNFNNMIKQHNLAIANELELDEQDIKMLGLK
jgi:hypothetical protein